MKRARTPSRPASGPPASEPGFTQDLRAMLVPERKWHCVFHLLVVLVALSYWIGSLVKLPEASWAEITLYRPKGDNQVYPVITALSRFNFGDPTDAFHYGKGVAGFHAVVLLPHALAVKVFGWPGYMIADAFFAMSYFVAMGMLLRRCGLGTLASLILASALATGSLQNLTAKAGLVLLKLVVTCNGTLTDWSFPNLIALNLFEPRIPRPLITEVFVVWILYFLVGLWRSAAPLRAGTGIALGVWIGLLAQGDPYSVSALGLVLAMVLGRNLAAQHWRIPWRFFAAMGLGALGVGAYFLFQLSAQNADASVRFGLASFSRARWMPLPGYGPVLRVAVVALFSGILLAAMRRQRMQVQAKLAVDSETPAASVGLPAAEMEDKATALTRSVAQFCIVLVGAAWLAQPLQLLLLGRGAQIYHYLAYTLPVFYSYAVVLLLVQYGIQATAWLRRLPAAPGVMSCWAGRTLLGCLLAGEMLLGMEQALDTIKSPLTARDEVSPWREIGTPYRAGLRGLDQAFRREPILRDSRTFATFNHEVNFLLAGFHDKRAYLPDNGFSTLSDAELERRLFEVAKICQLHPDRFASFIQHHQVLNFWLGCAKYWFASDHTFAPLAAYSEPQREQFKNLARETPFNLALPTAELQRLVSAYAAVTIQESDVSSYPDAIVVTSVLKQQQIFPHSGLYAETYTNAVFSVYTRIHAGGVFSAGPSPGR